MSKENIMILWEKLAELSRIIDSKNKEILQLTTDKNNLEEKLRGKESDLIQMRNLLHSNQQVFSQEKKTIETKIQTLMEKIDTLTPENE